MLRVRVLVCVCVCVYKTVNGGVCPRRRTNKKITGFVEGTSHLTLSPATGRRRLLNEDGDDDVKKKELSLSATDNAWWVKRVVLLFNDKGKWVG